MKVILGSLAKSVKKKCEVLVLSAYNKGKLQMIDLIMIPFRSIKLLIFYQKKVAEEELGRNQMFEDKV